MASTPPVKFLVTLLKMVENGDVLFDDGELLFEDPQLFASKVLPRYFKHSNVSSFERQLYYYSWKKIGKGSKSAPRAFCNQALEGHDPAMILALPRKANVDANKTSTSGNRNDAQNDTSPSLLPLSKHKGVDPVNIMAALSKETPRRYGIPFVGSGGRRSMSPGLSAFGAAASATSDGGDGNSRKRSRRIAPTAPDSSRDGPVRRDPWGTVERRLDASIASAGGAGRGGGHPGVRAGKRNGTEGQPLRSKGVVLAVPPGLPQGVGGRGSEGRTAVYHRTRSIFCGWQNPEPSTNGERRASCGGVDGVDHDGGSSTGEPAAIGGGRESSSALRPGPKTRDLDNGIVGDGGDGAGGGNGSSIHSLLTAVQIEINERRRRGGGGRFDHPNSGGDSAPQPLRDIWANSAIRLGYQERPLEVACPAEVDHPVLPHPQPQGLAPPAAEAFVVAQGSEPTAAPSAPASQAKDDSTSLRLVFTSSNASQPPSSPPEQQRFDGGGVPGTPTRSRLSSSSLPYGHGDAGFEGKNFGDSLLGSGGGNSDGFGPTSTSTKHGSGTASDDVSSFLATRCCGDGSVCRRAGGREEDDGGRGIAGGGPGVLLSPVQVLPLTPSPLSLNRPRECLLGLW